MSTANYITLIDELRAARTAKQISQRALAEELGVPATQVCHWEKRTKFPSLAVMLRWASAVGCKLKVEAGNG